MQESSRTLTGQQSGTRTAPSVIPRPCAGTTRTPTTCAPFYTQFCCHCCS